MADLRALSRDRWMHLLFEMYGFDLNGAALAYPGPKLALCVAGSWVEQTWAPTPVEVSTMAGVSHWLQLDEPTATNAALDRFLARIG